MKWIVSGVSLSYLGILVVIAVFPSILLHSPLAQLWRDVWLYDRLVIAEVVGLFALIPLSFLALVAIDKRRAK